MRKIVMAGIGAAAAAVIGLGSYAGVKVDDRLERLEKRKTVDISSLANDISKIEQGIGKYERKWTELSEKVEKLEGKKPSEKKDERVDNLALRMDAIYDRVIKEQEGIARLNIYVDDLQSDVFQMGRVVRRLETVPFNLDNVLDPDARFDGKYEALIELAPLPVPENVRGRYNTVLSALNDAIKKDTLYSPGAREHIGKMFMYANLEPALGDQLLATMAAKVRESYEIGKISP